MLLPFMHNGQQLLHQEERRPDIDRKQRVEILDRRLLHDGRPGHPGIGDENVESVADDGARLPRQFMRAVGRGPDRPRWHRPCRPICGFRRRPPRLPWRRAVMHQHLAPSLAIASALARPMPRDAPVTSAVFPLRLVMVVLRVMRADASCRRRPAGRPAAIDENRGGPTGWAWIDPMGAFAAGYFAETGASEKDFVGSVSYPGGMVWNCAISLFRRGRRGRQPDGGRREAAAYGAAFAEPANQGSRI